MKAYEYKDGAIGKAAIANLIGVAMDDKVRITSTGKLVPIPKSTPEYFDKDTALLKDKVSVKALADEALLMQTEDLMFRGWQTTAHIAAALQCPRHKAKQLVHRVRYRWQIRAAMEDTRDD